MNPQYLQPREKLLLYGVQSLSDAELLAIFLRTGIRGTDVLTLSQKLLNEFGSLYHLINADHKSFCSESGLGTVKYTQLKAVVELSHRYLKVQMTKESSLTNPSITHHYLASRLADKERSISGNIFRQSK